ncbi:MAG: hypothetical protein M8353_05635 [ANME-2 cluster archaeon]|nr:hypothetical protein [ANME-2 cluster archaeon]
MRYRSTCISNTGIKVFYHGTSFHAVTMIQNGLETIVSADKHFDSIEEVQRIAPF